MLVVCGGTTHYWDLAFHSSSLGTCEVLRRDIVRPSPYPQLPGPDLRIYEPRRQGGSSAGDLGSPSSRNDKNREPVTGCM